MVSQLFVLHKKRSQEMKYIAVNREDGGGGGGGNYQCATLEPGVCIEVTSGFHYNDTKSK